MPKTHKMKKSRGRKARRGGGWTDGGMIPGAAGYIQHTQYSGAGKDCPVVSVPRPGMLPSYQAPISGGLPGVGKMFGGSGRLGGTGPGSVAIAQAKMMKGGRWGADPALGPLNPVNGVGATGYAPIARLHCETGTYNSLNPNPNGIQTMSTAPPYVPGWTPYMKGGNSVDNRTPPPTVEVGAVDAMRIYSPTAGYSSVPMNPLVTGANAAVQMQIGYPAGGFNPACLKTGGAAPLVPLTASQIGNRMDFDGTNGALPVKYGGVVIGIMDEGVAAGAGSAITEQRIPTPAIINGSLKFNGGRRRSSKKSRKGGKLRKARKARKTRRN
jgi:hypothetical protein